MAYPYQWAPTAKELTEESTFTFMADNFPAFPAGNPFCDLYQQKAFRYLLIAKIGIPATNSFGVAAGGLFLLCYNSVKPTSSIGWLASC